MPISSYFSIVRGGWRRYPASPLWDSLLIWRAHVVIWAGSSVISMMSFVPLMFLHHNLYTFVVAIIFAFALTLTVLLTLRRRCRFRRRFPRSRHPPAGPCRFGLSTPRLHGRKSFITLIIFVGLVDFKLRALLINICRSPHQVCWGHGHCRRRVCIEAHAPRISPGCTSVGPL